MIYWRKVLAELAVSLGSFWASAYLLGGWVEAPWLAPLMGLFFWFQFKIRERGDRSALAQFLENAVIGVGLNLVALGVLLYLLVLASPPPTEPLVAGSILAAFLLTQGREMLGARKPRYLFLDPDPATMTLAQGLPGGVAADFAHRLPTASVADAVILPSSSYLPAPELARLRANGVHVWSAAAFYEAYTERVCASSLRPADFFLQDNLFPFRPVMVLQAIYTNLIGLAVLLTMSPLIALLAVLILLTTRGPAFDRIHCVGLHSIPFELRRFRTRGPDWKLTWIGRVIETLRLARLPELINVVRGELALIGPRPVRAEHAVELNRLIPFHFRRFAVRPGLAGWAEANCGFDEWLEEITRLEYDLYFIKNASLLMDLEIVLRLITGAFRRGS
jgi:lipopolysaccharide/colanic/teichoic acid biosynthesis glycosyltransferase